MEDGMAGFMGAYWLLIIIGYIYGAVVLMVIAQKTGHTENAWLAWIPIANIVLMLQVADKPIWWIILMLIPFVNFVIGIIVWWAICEARGKEGWLSILLLVPIVNIFVMGYIAFTD